MRSIFISLARQDLINVKIQTTRQLEKTARYSYDERQLGDLKLALLEIINRLAKFNNIQKAHKQALIASSEKVPREDNGGYKIGHKVNKRSPGCLLWCLNKRILHPAQCHSYCTFSG